MHIPPDRWFLFCWLLLTIPGYVSATPYAAAVTNINGQLTFTLNESADTVTVLHQSGPPIVLHSPHAGEHTVGIGNSSGYQIVVEKNTGPGWRQGVIQQLSSDTDTLMKFAHPRGVCVNRNPGYNFGRIYISMSLPSTNDPPRAEGIYLLGPDLRDTFGAGARTGGLDFAEPDNNALSPFRLSIGSDDSLYICDLSASTGTLYVTGPDVTNGKNVFGLRLGGDFPIGTNRIRGSISAAYIEGASGSSNLVVWVVDEDRQQNREDPNRTTCNSIWRWEILTENLPASNTVPVRLTGSPLAGNNPQIADLARGPDGKFYASQLRAPAFLLPGATTAGLFVLTPDGSSNMWNSLAASRLVQQNPSATDILTDTCAIDVSHDGKYIAVLRTNSSRINIVPLINGLPDLTNRIHLATLPSLGPAEDIAFDAAGNIYYVSSSQGLLRVLSAGGSSRAVTRSDKTFEIQYDVAPPEIRITGILPSMMEVQIDFTFSQPANANDFRLESAPSVDPVQWTLENSAIIIPIGGGFRALAPRGVEGRFYRVKR